ncbi:hypothetical protein [Adhaeribacter pallidiroseus]|uniref:hypothetical protein n=1 Tax=Adhaeribacter pallidiroseus TaxID=2072847 RepID=UPI000E1BCEFB|nr:hypothetical protein [Adhaeribacter pallidiroseus]
MKQIVTYRKKDLTPIQGIKVYEGALAIANKRKFKTTFLFFLLVKQISKSGTIHNYIKVIERHTGLKKAKYIMR